MKSKSMPKAAYMEKLRRAGREVLDPMTNAPKLVRDVMKTEVPACRRAAAMRCSMEGWAPWRSVVSKAVVTTKTSSTPIPAAMLCI